TWWVISWREALPHQANRRVTGPSAAAEPPSAEQADRPTAAAPSAVPARIRRRRVTIDMSAPLIRFTDSGRPMKAQSGAGQKPVTGFVRRMDPRTCAETLLGQSEQPVAGVTEAGHDVADLVEVVVHRGDDERAAEAPLGHQPPQLLHTLRGGQQADAGDLL